jgi:hypothetical protein
LLSKAVFGQCAARRNDTERLKNNFALESLAPCERGKGEGKQTREVIFRSLRTGRAGRRKPPLRRSVIDFPFRRAAKKSTLQYVPLAGRERA